MKTKLSCAIAYNVHDSSVSFAIGAKIVLVLEAERFFKEKKKRCDQPEMEQLVNFGLSYLERDIGDIAFWSMTTLYNPFLEPAEIFGTSTGTPAPPFWKDIDCFGARKKIWIVNHHLAHAAAYLLSPFDNALIITGDGGGDYDRRLRTSECHAVFTGKGTVINRLAVNPSTIITGKFYALGATLIFGKKHQEGKLMALAAFGQEREEYLSTFQTLCPIIEKADYQTGEALIKTAFAALQGAASASEPSRDARDFCTSLQNFFVKTRVAMVGEILKEMDIDSLVMAGGTGLNLELNSEVDKAFPAIKKYIAPCCDDTGQSLGALSLLIAEIYRLKPEAKLPYLGMGERIVEVEDPVLEEIIDVLLDDGIVMLHNGQAEIGPRALGNRSFIARPDRLSVQVKLSQIIKQRERYRPVAPIVLESKFEDYFEGYHPSPFMLYKCHVRQNKTKELIGAVHADQSARVQTVAERDNIFLYKLLEKFGRRTGIYVLLNTSLNLQGEPIASDPADSLRIYQTVKGPKLLVQNGHIYRE